MTQLLDVYPAKGHFLPGELMHTRAVILSQVALPAVLELSFYHLAEVISIIQKPIYLKGGKQTFTLSWQPPVHAGAGYGIRVRLLDGNAEEIDQRSTACDVLNHWTDYPRYGFMCDFAADKTGIETDLEVLSSFHINGLQFYDWQYRHHELVPPAEDYIDPLGRRLSLTTVRRMLEAAHQCGMACLPYLAIYAAGLEFWTDHPEWALFDSEGRPMKFFDFLGLMDPTPGHGWSEHLLDQCDRVLQALPFDGLHVDQYGEPKHGWDANGQPVDLPVAFSRFIHAVKVHHRDAVLIFNAVGNWPIENLAPAPVDMVYIEVWPPSVGYSDLVEIIHDARRLSGDKAVILALYQPGENENNILLANACILAAGGTRISIGESGRWLADPYFPKHQPLNQEFNQKLRLWNDFIVRYGELLGPQAEVMTDVLVSSPEGILAFPRQAGNWVAIGLVNTSGLAVPHWNEAHPAPIPQSSVAIEIQGLSGISQAGWACPEQYEQVMTRLDFHKEGNKVVVNVPWINYFAFIAISLEKLENLYD